jgi:hypothetical protein
VPTEMAVTTAPDEPEPELLEDDPDPEPDDPDPELPEELLAPPLLDPPEAGAGQLATTDPPVKLEAIVGQSLRGPQTGAKQTHPGYGPVNCTQQSRAPQLASGVQGRPESGDGAFARAVHRHSAPGAPQVPAV